MKAAPAVTKRGFNDMPYRVALSISIAVVLLHLMGTGSVAHGQDSPEPRYKALAFDAFPILDPRPIAALAEEMYPGHGQELMGLWRIRLFEYQWLRALGGRYADFMETAEDSLVFATTMLGLELTDEIRSALLSAHMNLTPWPDAAPAIDQLHAAGVRLIFLSNMTEEMLVSGLEGTELEKAFENIVSTNRARTYKPDPSAYRLGVEALDLERDEILFVAFAGWDVAGAKWFGYPTFWVNRMGSPLEELGATPDDSGPDLNALVEFVLPKP